PDVDFKTGGMTTPLKPMLWAVLDTVPLKQGGYDYFKSYFSMTSKEQIDLEIESINERILNHRIPVARIEGKFQINGVWYIVFEYKPGEKAILMLGRRPLRGEVKIYSGEKGYYWSCVSHGKKRAHLKMFAEAFNLSNSEGITFKKVSGC
ncbi:MAG: hypothetical protein WDA41_09835, partial [Candidatus Neomarinimicrobiota bacterium]